LGLNAQNYSRVKKCPIFEYNGVDHVTNKPFGQGDEAGINQTIAGVTLFGGTLCLPDELQLCQHGGDLLNFPVVMDATVVITNGGPNMEKEAGEIGSLFSGSLGTSVFVRADRDGSTSFLTEYLANSLPGNPDTGDGQWCIPPGSDACFGCGDFSADQWAGAVVGGLGIPGLITPVTGPVAMMAAVQAVSPLDATVYGYIGWQDFQALKSTGDYNNVNFVAIQSNTDSGDQFVSPSAESIGKQLMNLQLPVRPDLLIDTIGSNTQGNNGNPLADAYPMASPANIVVRCCQFSKCQVIELRKFLYYLATVGQGNAEQFGLAQLTPEIVSQYIKNLNLLESSEDCIDNAVLKCCEC
jgi:ABC-type phosphate transport system substrate-binding protein